MVSRVGIGTWQLGGQGWGSFDREAGVQAVRTALDLGINLFDTAQAYGNGESERLLGEVLGSAQRGTVIVSKTGWDGNFKPDAIRQRLHDSLRRLQRDYLDVYLLHGPDTNTIREGSAIAELLRLKDEGHIRAWGIALASHWSTRDQRWISALAGDGEDGIAALSVSRPDVVEVVYNPISRKVADLLFPRLQGVGIIARGVLASGLLAACHDSARPFPSDDLRSGLRDPWRRAVLEVGHEIHKKTGLPAAALAIAFAASHPDVSVAIVGTRNPGQVEEAVAASRMAPLNDEHLQQVIDSIDRCQPPLSDYDAWTSIATGEHAHD